MVDRDLRYRPGHRLRDRRRPQQRHPGREHEPGRRGAAGIVHRRWPAGGDLQIDRGGRRLCGGGRQLVHRRVDVHPGGLSRGGDGLGDDRLRRRARRPRGVPLRRRSLRHVLRRSARRVLQQGLGDRRDGTGCRGLLVLGRRRVPELERDEHGRAARRRSRGTRSRRGPDTHGGAGREAPRADGRLP